MSCCRRNNYGSEWTPESAAAAYERGIITEAKYREIVGLAKGTGGGGGVLAATADKPWLLPALGLGALAALVAATRGDK